MIRVKQRTDQDCYACCLAAILEVPYEKVPIMPPEDDNWSVPYTDFLRERGLYLTAVDVRKCPEYTPIGYHMIVGDSQNQPGQKHAIVGLDGRFCFDPSKNVRQMRSSSDWDLFEVFCLIDPGVAR